MAKSTTAQASGGGLTFAGGLTLLFIGLKLTNYITWSWWWVLSPLWLPAAVILGAALVGLTVLIVIALAGAIAESVGS